MKTAAHPDQSMSHDFLEPVGIGVTEAAKKLGGSHNWLFNGVNGLSEISMEMTIRTSPQDRQPAVRVDEHSSFHDASAGLLLRPVAGSVARKPEPGQISEKAVALEFATYDTAHPEDRVQGLCPDRGRLTFGSALLLNSRPMTSRPGISLFDFQEFRTEPAFSHASTSPGTT